MEEKPLQLVITARESTTVLPRCLQILSRRGFTLTALQTEDGGRQSVIMRCTVHGPQRWHVPVLSLLERVVDVRSVTTDGART